MSRYIYNISIIYSFIQLQPIMKTMDLVITNSRIQPPKSSETMFSGAKINLFVVMGHDGS